MEQLVKYNNLSEKLLGKVKQAMPKLGQVIWFVSSRPKARGTTILGFDRIWDPWVRKVDDEWEGNYVDIAYLPKSNSEPDKSRVTFTYAQKGRIGIRGGNKHDEQLFTFLYLTNRLGNNKDKPWFVQEPGRAFMCFMEMPSKSAKDKNEFRRKVRIAGETIDELPDSKLREFAIGLEMKSINLHSDPEEIRDQLYKIADKDPDKIVGLDKDVSFRMKIELKEAEKLGVIEFNGALNELVWADTKDVICVVPPGKNKYEALTKFFIREKGSKIYPTIRDVTRRKAEPKVSSTGSDINDDNQPPVKNKGGRPRKVVEPV